ncbi:hypothetical protein CJU90_6257 [Yarrowia sp. C11]|nr:hypothetical protein CJU90_6257 [Yarrowia sp. C11]KAG5370962.1 hypothetical protein CKK34_1097 [Yarrowia sp. E02]
MLSESPSSSFATAMDSDYGIQSILSDDDQDSWHEIDAPLLERPTSSGFVMPAISADGSVVSSRETMSRGEGFLNGDFPLPTFAQLQTSCLCKVPLCGCDKLRAMVDNYFGHATGNRNGYVVVYEAESEHAKLAKVAVLKHRTTDGRAVMFLDTQFRLSKGMKEGLNEVEGVEVIVLNQKKEYNQASSMGEKTVRDMKSGTEAISYYAKVLLSAAIVLFFLFNPQTQMPGISTSSESNITYFGPPQPVSPFIYEIPEAMIFDSCHPLDKPEVHVAVHQPLDMGMALHFLSEGFQRLYNGLKNLPALLNQLLGLGKDVFETNSERTLRKIEDDMDLLGELLDEILEELTAESLQDALYIWNKMAADIAEPLKTLKYDEKTTSASFLTIIKLEKRLKVVGEKLANAKMGLRGEARAKARRAGGRMETGNHAGPGKATRAREIPRSHQTVPQPKEYMNRMEDRDQHIHKRPASKGERRGRQEGRRAQRNGAREEIW